MKKLLLLGLYLYLYGNSLIAVTVAIETQEAWEFVEFEPENMVINSDIYNLVSTANEIDKADIAVIEFSAIVELFPGVVGYRLVGNIINNDDDIDPDIKNILDLGSGYLKPLEQIIVS